MTLSPRVRYHYGLIVVAINVVISLIFSFLKYQKMKEMDPTIEGHEEYLKMREYYQFLGFKFMHDTIRSDDQDAHEGAYSSELDMLSSWSIECWLYPLMLICIYFLNTQRNKIKFLLQESVDIDKVVLTQRDGMDLN